MQNLNFFGVYDSVKDLINRPVFDPNLAPQFTFFADQFKNAKKSTQARLKSLQETTDAIILDRDTHRDKLDTMRKLVDQLRDNHASQLLHHAGIVEVANAHIAQLSNEKRAAELAIERLELENAGLTEALEPFLREAPDEYIPDPTPQDRAARRQQYSDQLRTRESVNKHHPLLRRDRSELRAILDEYPVITSTSLATPSVRRKIAEWETTNLNLLFAIERGLALGCRMYLKKPSEGRVRTKRGGTNFYLYHIVIALIDDRRWEIRRMTPNPSLATDLEFSHLCHNALCCNPAHIVLEERKQNKARNACRHAYIIGVHGKYVLVCNHGETGVLRTCIVPYTRDVTLSAFPEAEELDSDV